MLAGKGDEEAYKDMLGLEVDAELLELEVDTELLSLVEGKKLLRHWHLRIAVSVGSVLQPFRFQSELAMNFHHILEKELSATESFHVR